MDLEGHHDRKIFGKVHVQQYLMQLKIPFLRNQKMKDAAVRTDLLQMSTLLSFESVGVGLVVLQGYDEFVEELRPAPKSKSER